MFFDILEHLNRMLGSSLIANFLLAKICPHKGYHVLQEVHQRNPWILHILRLGRAQSFNAPLLPVAMYSSYETRTLFRLFVQRPSRHFFLALLLLFFYDDAMRGTTTQGQRPPRQRHVDNTTPHPTTQPTTTRDRRHDMSRHHTQKKNKDTHVHAHVHVSVCVHVHVGVIVCSFWNTYLP